MAERIGEDDPRVQRTLGELQELIRGRYPQASFQTYRGEDPEGIYLDATVDVDDTDEVMDLIIDRLLQAQVDEGLPVYVIPLRPLEKVLEEMRVPSAVRRSSVIDLLGPTL
jgi:hypothetical protein